MICFPVRSIEEAHSLGLVAAEGQGEGTEPLRLEGDGGVAQAGEEPPRRPGDRRIEDERVSLVPREVLAGPDQPLRGLWIIDELAWTRGCGTGPPGAASGRPG